MKVIKRSYNVFHIIVKDNVSFIYGNCTSILEISSKKLKISCKVNKIYTTDNIDNIRTIIRRSLREDNANIIRLCCLFSRKLICKILKIPIELIKKIPITCEYFPYVSLGELDIIRKIGIIHLIDEIFISNMFKGRELEDSEKAYVIHYILMLLGYNYDPSMISLGRIIYEKYRVKS